MVVMFSHRAILRKPALLLCDEVTSSVDAFAEREIISSLHSLSSSTTTITVAHRLATVVDCDRIYVFDKGEVVEVGTHRELLKRDGGVYRRLWEAQHRDSSSNSDNSNDSSTDSDNIHISTGTNHNEGIIPAIDNTDTYSDASTISTTSTTCVDPLYLEPEEELSYRQYLEEHAPLNIRRPSDSILWDSLTILEDKYSSINSDSNNSTTTSSDIDNSSKTESDANGTVIELDNMVTSSGSGGRDI
jgi:ABC-type multidrug transport system ATPase subunit